MPILFSCTLDTTTYRAKFGNFWTLNLSDPKSTLDHAGIHTIIIRTELAEPGFNRLDLLHRKINTERVRRPASLYPRCTEYGRGIGG